MTAKLESAQQRAWHELGELLFGAGQSPPLLPRAGAPIEPLALRPKEAAAAIGLSRPQIFRFMQNGTLPSFKVGKARLIAVSDLKAWLERNRDA